MLKLFSYVENFYYKVENEWSLVLSFFLIVVFLLMGYVFTKMLENK